MIELINKIFDYYKLYKKTYHNCLRHVLKHELKIKQQINTLFISQINKTKNLDLDDVVIQSKLIDLSIIQMNKAESFLMYLRLAKINETSFKNDSKNIDEILKEIIKLSIEIYQDNKRKYSIYNLWLYYIEQAYINNDIKTLNNIYRKLLKEPYIRVNKIDTSNIDLLITNKVNNLKKSYQFTLNENDL